MSEYQDILDFWFQEIDSSLWFHQKDDVFDVLVKDRFFDRYEQARDGHFDHWASEPEGVLALCLLLDQFPRNIFRGKAEAFATDQKILGIVKNAIEQGLDKHIEVSRRKFIYLPFEHSEDIGNQKRSVSLFEALKDEDPLSYDYALRHIDIIERFGHFPQRNIALGRKMKEEEEQYLEELAQAGRNY